MNPNLSVNPEVGFASGGSPAEPTDTVRLFFVVSVLWDVLVISPAIMLQIHGSTNLSPGASWLIALAVGYVISALFLFLMVSAAYVINLAKTGS